MGIRSKYCGRSFSCSFECMVWLCSETPVRNTGPSRRPEGKTCIRLRGLFIGLLPVCVVKPRGALLQLCESTMKFNCGVNCLDTFLISIEVPGWNIGPDRTIRGELFDAEKGPDPHSS